MVLATPGAWLGREKSALPTLPRQIELRRRLQTARPLKMGGNLVCYRSSGKGITSVFAATSMRLHYPQKGSRGKWIFLIIRAKRRKALVASELRRNAVRRKRALT